ncbi:alpha-L-fucosidase [Rhizomicrobium palustre]|uniref:alpha-L-fucosidase n=1 Tax=Rhizomicrobium palustre TaxID=189966 RepID=A0A846MUY8_9PROT|nr:alpha-L-fucosidase [Rhizomicrobium palustre]NIK86827.1 alpha-L-fucosidase [Rhizomicrobium palustre]
MKPSTTRLAVGFAALCLAAGQLASAKSTPPLAYGDTQVIAAGDSDAVIAEKAAKVLPRENQKAWMRLENTFFLHFGPNTFRGLEWGDGREDPAIFNPTALDAEQWVRSMKEAGGRMIILVAKHHDGLNLWPTRYSEHSVAASPWRGGKGNLVREVADAARKYGLKLGIYLSPADLWQLKTNPKNPNPLYGNGSTKRPSVIPTDPARFQSDPSQGRAATPGFARYSYTVDDYNRYFLNQLYELLTEYGPVQEVWFDGANPDPSVQEAYDYTAWYDLIRKLQPGAIIFGKGPDARWVGNESGVGRKTEWSVIPLPTAPQNFNWPDMQDEDLGSRAKLVPGSHLWWYPAEVNTSILYGWFWHPKKRVKTASDLIDFYYQSVGRNGNYLLNLPPDTRGLIPENQLASLRLMAQVIRETFANNLAAGATLSADTSAKGHEPGSAIDGNLDSWWAAAPGHKQVTLILTLPKAKTFDVVSLQEAVDHRGQRIEAFAVDIWDGSAWKQMDAQTTIGHKRLLRWNEPVTSDRIRIRITSSRLEPSLAEIGLFKQAEIVQPPVISERSLDGVVTLNSSNGLKIVYTTDGSVPTLQSPVYSGPLALEQGGTVSAACVAEDGRLGMLASRRFAGFRPKGWKLVGSSQDNAAIDSNSATVWHAKNGTLPASMTVDMGRALRIGGFSYLPSSDASGAVDSYSLETSTDGRNWTTVIANDRFGNIANDPALQEVTFAPVTARYFRFTALKLAKGQVAGIAEISVLPSDPAK